MTHDSTISPPEPFAPPVKVSPPVPFALAVDQASALLGILEPDGRVIYANRRALELIGASADDVLGVAWWNTPLWFDDEGRRRAQAAVAVVAQLDTHVRFKARRSARSGDEVHHDVTLTPLRDGDGALVALLVEGFDVTARWRDEQAVRHSLEQMEGLFAAVPDAVVAVDESRRVVMFNPAAERAFGWEVSEILGRPLDVLLPEHVVREHDAHVERFLAEAADGESHARRATRMLSARRRDGTIFPVDASLVTFTIGTRRLYCAVLRDITEQLAAERALEEERRRTALILAAAAEGIIGIDGAEVVTFANAAAAALLDRSVESMVGKPVDEILHAGRHRAAHDPSPTVTAMRTGLAFEGEDAYARADGSSFPVDFSVRSLVVDASPAGAVLSFRDVTERKAAEAQLLALSLLDELTGVHNRRGFVTLARQELALARRGGLSVLLCYVDVDRFKQINDQYGHAVGDRALRHVADALRSTFRESDVVGRIGGDEFVALAPVTGAGTSPDAVVASFGRRLDRALAERVARDASGAPVSVTTGWIVSTAHDERGLEALLAEADAALYARKRAR